MMETIYLFQKRFIYDRVIARGSMLNAVLYHKLHSSPTVDKVPDSIVDRTVTLNIEEISPDAVIRINDYGDDFFRDWFIVVEYDLQAYSE